MPTPNPLVRFILAFFPLPEPTHLHSSALRGQQTHAQHVYDIRENHIWYLWTSVTYPASSKTFILQEVSPAPTVVSVANMHSWRNLCMMTRTATVRPKTA
ncbi:hypothetical protein PISMIDRAFT_688974 [Pisolithus microcarpus 441]|uniref:Unplaced genomic scaffold scaffold_332, whole genome shotgun sequence n=1 Tax=Pisolithus microcarpus 441 TaxID=765257 RepID=A0A0C9XLG5_9AGAM|nr:hypothetical protein PISMIDRAFT_690430 [Pisolithus microcarpus 441]KIK13170.1 hypothetical protein PISMIDRAFT_688974 [Pisolithus microcarpus 441]